MIPFAPNLPSSLREPLSRLAALHAGHGSAIWLTADGEVEELSPTEAARRALAAPPLVCHAKAVGRRLGAENLKAYDLLELYAFVLPARFVLPTAEGLAQAFSLEKPVDPESHALVLIRVAEILLGYLHVADDAREIKVMRRLAIRMGATGWPWATLVLAVLGGEEEGGIAAHAGFDVWNRLDAWEERAPPSPPSDHSVGEEESKGHLAGLLGPGSEHRPTQFEFAAAASAAFQPREHQGVPNLVLAEAGTGVGKTLGYIAPASIWAERNQGAVWISTYTKNLQRQVDQELIRLYPEAAVKKEKVVVRKGRENYLCLLNYEDAVKASLTSSPRHVVALGLMARWIGASRDGDMVGGDFPSWLVDLLGRNATLSLSDRRGECVYSACPHYQKCFIEISRRKAERARMVIANHALVMLRAAMGTDQDGIPPTRFVFDEGHHIFDAADNAFAAHINGLEGAELRRWVLGSEISGRASRARGLENRIGDLIADMDEGPELLEKIKRGALCLPGQGWLRRIAEEGASGPYERFLACLRELVLARAPRDEGFSLESGVEEPGPSVMEAAEKLQRGLQSLAEPMSRLIDLIGDKIADEAEDLDSSERLRLDAAMRGMGHRRDMLKAWQRMLQDLKESTPEAFVDWFALDRIQRRDSDVGMYRHWVDPTKPFADTLLSQAHGVVITSATLRDKSPEGPDDWTSAEVRTGALHMPMVAQRCSLASPYDYGRQTKVFIVNDLHRDHADQVAGAYRALFKASGGGGLGLFTAIHRLRAVYQQIAPDLEAAGLSLLAQHMDAMDVGTLVDIFRASEDACLLGTDAVRDGVDVPGRALRLIVFDRVPWPRPSILHKARRNHFGGNAYDDMITRLRLKQAFGRLVRHSQDHGVFVMLDGRTPSRLLTAFPEGVEVARIGLAEAVKRTEEFFAPSEINSSD